MAAVSRRAMAEVIAQDTRERDVAGRCSLGGLRGGRCRSGRDLAGLPHYQQAVDHHQCCGQAVDGRPVQGLPGSSQLEPVWSPDQCVDRTLMWRDAN